jgi:hypothetical protein
MDSVTAVLFLTILRLILPFGLLILVGTMVQWLQARSTK